MSQENLEPNPFTLNPLYLKAARDEADFRRKAEPMDREALPLRTAYTREEKKAHSNPTRSSLDQTKTLEAEAPEPFDRAERPANEGARPDEESAENQREPASPKGKSRAAIANKQAEIARVRREIDKLTMIKDSAYSVDLTSYKAKLNELRFKRVAIQMALVSGSDEYDDGDLLALDKQIAELVKLIAHDRKPEAASKDIAAELNAKIDGLQSEVEFLTGELRKLVADHNLGLAVRKAEDYIKALKVAHNLRHELLALAALGPSDGPLRNLNLGGELPRPCGFATFASILSEDLAITVEGVEEAKARIRAELAL